MKNHFGECKSLCVTLTTAILVAVGPIPASASTNPTMSAVVDHEKVFAVNTALSNLGIKIASKYETPITTDLGFQTLLTNAGLVQVNYEKKSIIYSNNVFKIDDKGQLVSSNARVVQAFLDDLEYKIVAKSPQEKYRIQVFTDITCHFCQAFHQNLPQLLNNGITVEFILFARNGDKTPEFFSMSAIESQSNQLQALTNAMNGILPQPTASTASLQMVLHQQAAISVGVTATPSLFYKGIPIPNVKTAEMLKLLASFDEEYDASNYKAFRVN